MSVHLIYGNNQDYHSAAVHWALAQMGQAAEIWDGIGPERDGRIVVELGARPTVWLAGRAHDRFRSVWFRRPATMKSAPHVAGEVKNFVILEAAAAHQGLGAITRGMSDFVVGSEIAEYSDIKAYQLQAARQVGFRTPPTLITNDREAALRFVCRHQRVAIKPFNVYTWQESGEGGYRIASTAVVEHGGFDPPPKSLESCPCILQKYIEKRCELRVTVVGEHLFAARISKGFDGGFVDWRYAIGRDDFSVSPYELPTDLQVLIHAYMAAAGLTFGCIDLVVDQEGEVWFLEVNPAGQFLFIEEWLPEFGLLAAFAAMLKAGSTNFHLPTHTGVTVKAFAKTWRERHVAV